MHVSQGFRMARLSGTIRDAVVVTRKLGQSFLWVDALCILQDSEEDKVVQLGAFSAVRILPSTPLEHPVAQIPYRCPENTMGAVYIGLLASLDGTADASSQWDWDGWAPIPRHAWGF
ncbi:hypothetical protein GGR53DRAFT_465330 [Hypoxylon sp. FL1150]|nr:hypothetical protein GGR53DRAFT_465330 [Hypoxylon sp. FL1150]